MASLVVSTVASLLFSARPERLAPDIPLLSTLLSTPLNIPSAPCLTITAEKRFDVAVVGASISGCATAIAFARQGRQVLLIDPFSSATLSLASHILHPGGVATLHKLGMKGVLDEINTCPVRGYTVHVGDESTGMFFSTPCKGDGWGEKGDNTQGVAFRREEFVQALRKQAKDTRGVVAVQGTVTQVLRGGMSGEIVGVEVYRKNESYGVHFFADLTILCDGVHSGLRSDFLPKHHFRSLVNKTQQEPLTRHWAFDIPDGIIPVEEMACSILDAAGTHVTLFRISRRTIRAHVEITERLVDTLGIKGDGFAAAGALRGHLTENVAPRLPAPVRASFIQAVGRVRLEPVPLGLTAAKGTRYPGLFMVHEKVRTGDIACDSGIMVALKDILLVTQLLGGRCIRHLGNSWKVRMQLGKFEIRRKRHAAPLDMVERVVAGWDHRRDPTHDILRHSLVRYLSKGELAYRSPIQTLGGLMEKRVRLAHTMIGLTKCAMIENMKFMKGTEVHMALWRLVSILWLSLRLTTSAVYRDIIC